MSQSPQSIVTRFAPSPTGQLHVGGARTALYAWAFARGHDGTFLLRIEDTDQQRSTDAAADAIMEDLRWLGLQWDNADEVPRQSERLPMYQKVVDKLLEDDLAYEDEGAVRFRMEEDVVFEDAVYGRIETPANDLEDFIIQKSDGYPTFHLAVVVDDHDMGVTHVIRGQEHLSNTPRHAALCDALGYDRPTWAHTPSIMNADGSKMSKRDKAAAARKAGREAGLTHVEGVEDEWLEAFLDGDEDQLVIAVAIAEELELDLPEIDVADFRASGYLPGVLCNYIALLGWNPGDDRERFTRQELTDLFSLDRINRKNARFDREKLFRFNADTLSEMDADTFAEVLADHLRTYHPAFEPILSDPNRYRRFVQAYQDRARTLSEPAQLGHFFVVEDQQLNYDPKAVKKVLEKNDGQGYDVLSGLQAVLTDLSDWTADAIDTAIRDFANRRELGMGKVAQPIRVAVSGSTVSPSIDDTLLILGRRSTLARIERCLEQADD